MFSVRNVDKSDPQIGVLSSKIRQNKSSRGHPVVTLISRTLRMGSQGQNCSKLIVDRFTPRSSGKRVRGLRVTISKYKILEILRGINVGSIVQKPIYI